MVVLSEDARALLESPALAHLVTLNPDGRPQVSCVWVGLDGDEIVCAHLPRNQKVKNIERDGRVALSIQAPGRNEWGLDRYLVVNGTARIVPGGAAALLQELAHSYLGPDAVFPGPDAPDGYVARITVDKVGGVGDWSA